MPTGVLGESSASGDHLPPPAAAPLPQGERASKRERRRERRVAATKEAERRRGRKIKTDDELGEAWDRTLELMWPKSVKLLREHQMWPPPKNL
jgi:hypothetical protein